MKMKWYGWGKYAIVNFKYSATSLDKVIKMEGYSIAKCLVLGVYVYTLYKLPCTIIGHYENAELAKEKCQAIVNGNG